MKCFLNKLHQVHSRMIGKTNNIKVFGTRKPTGLSSQLMPHMSEVGEPNISNTPCQCRNTDYWTDYNYIRKKQENLDIKFCAHEVFLE